MQLLLLRHFSNQFSGGKKFISLNFYLKIRDLFWQIVAEDELDEEDVDVDDDDEVDVDEFVEELDDDDELSVVSSSPPLETTTKSIFCPLLLLFIASSPTP